MEGIFAILLQRKTLRKGKLAEDAANHIVDFLKKNFIDKSLKAIGGDSTKLNTRWRKVEINLNPTLISLICAFHTKTTFSVFYHKVG